MNLRDLSYLVAVADLKHFGKAAEQCHVSQPTLSGQIKKLEDYLGATIFERTNKRVMLTDAGETIIASARRILREVDTIKDIATHSHDPLSGTFRLGAFPTLATYTFPQLVTQTRQYMPHMRFILVEEKTALLVEQLKQGIIDAALLALPVYDEFLVSQKLFDDPFYLATPPEHPLAQAKEIDHSTLNGHPLLLLEEGHCLRDQALTVCSMHQTGEEQDFRATGLETLRQMVKAGTGITLMPQTAIQKNEQDICYIPFISPAPKRTIGMVWRKTSPRVEAIHQICGLVGG